MAGQNCLQPHLCTYGSIMNPVCNNKAHPFYRSKQVRPSGAVPYGNRYVRTAMSIQHRKILKGSILIQVRNNAHPFYRSKQVRPSGAVCYGNRYVGTAMRRQSPTKCLQLESLQQIKVGFASTRRKSAFRVHDYTKHPLGYDACLPAILAFSSVTGLRVRGSTVCDVKYVLQWTRNICVPVFDLPDWLYGFRHAISASQSSSHNTCVTVFDLPDWFDLSFWRAGSRLEIFGPQSLTSHIGFIDFDLSFWRSSSRREIFAPLSLTSNICFTVFDLPTWCSGSRLAIFAPSLTKNIGFLVSTCHFGVPFLDLTYLLHRI